MKATYCVSIVREGMADLPELCRCEDALAAIAVVQALLDARDAAIRHVVVTVRRPTVQLIPDVPGPIALPE